MSTEEELIRLRKEARGLRQENAILKNAWDSQKNRSGKLGKTLKNKETRINTLEKKIDELEKENNELKSRLGLEIDKAKTYAGMIFKSNVRKRGEKSKNHRGALIGHKGFGKTKPERVDKEVNVYLTNCYDCGAHLNRTSSVDERIVTDIPQIVPVATRYTIERQWCAHCHKEARGIPLNTIPGMRFGLGITATILFLKYRMRSPLAKIEELLTTQYKLDITSSGIQEILHTVKVKFNNEYNNILEEIRNAPIKNADETSFRVDGLNGWCWLFATPSATFYTIEETRGKEEPTRILGHDPTGLLVRDDCPS